MNKIEFKNKGEIGAIPINADNLNLLQTNTENAINELSDNLNSFQKNTENAMSEFSNKIIHDSGSNLNGSWIRYEDGTMICYKTITGTIDITTAWGSLYTSLDLQLGDLPQTFTSLPVIIYSPQTQSGTQYMVTGSNGGDHRTNSSCGDICLVRPLSKTDVQFVIDIIAIGCWK